MPNSEDYLDGLLNSINQAKSDVEKAQSEEEKSIQAKIADMSSVDPNDDFMTATGISGFKAEKMTHNNLRQAFSESDFLKDFENELSSGSADDFIREFEQEIDDEEERFQRGEEIPDDAGSEFIRSLMEEDGVDSDDIPTAASSDDSSTYAGKEAVIEDVTDTEEEFSQADIDEAAIESATSQSNLPDIDENDPIATFDAITNELVGGEETDETSDASADEASGVDESADSASEDDSASEEALEGESDSASSEGESSEESLSDGASSDETSSEETGDNAGEEEVDTSAEDAEELLAALGEMEGETESSTDLPEDEADSESIEDNVSELSEEEQKLDDMTSSQELLDILDEVENIVGDDENAEGKAESGDDDSILSKEYQSDEHDEADALEVKDEGVSLVDEDADLESLLEGEEGMSDIGDLLDADKNDVELDEAREAFEESADKAENATEASQDEEPKEKVGLLDKIKGIFKKKKKGDGEEEKEILDVAAKNEVEDTTEENKKILEEMDEEEAEELAKKQEKAEKKAEKKAAKKAAKEEKKAAKQAAKEAKAKEEKKPSKVALFFKNDKSNKVPVKVIVVFVILVATLVTLIIIGCNIYNKNTTISDAKSYYSQGNYIDAYNSLASLSSLSEEDTEIMNKARLLADLQNKKKEYDTFMAEKDYQNAFDALVVGVGRYKENYDTAKEYGITAEYDGVLSMITGQLKDQFGTSKEEAEKLYDIKGRTKYTVAINDKLKALGMSNGSNN